MTASQSQALGQIAVEDVGNIVAMEHVNLWVPDMGLATAFYIVGMGFTRDPFHVVGPDAMWVNVGRQQFHLPARGVQVIPGHAGVVVKDLDALERRLGGVRKKLAGTQFAFAREADHVAVTSPWGNRLHCRAPDPQAFGRMTLGIPYVEFLVRPGTAQGIGRFYEKVFGVGTATESDGDLAVTRVEVGDTQWLLFRETAEPIPAYDGHHIAIYANRVSGAYGFLQARGLIMEEMVRHQFRFKDIVDPETGELLLQLEHEVRSMRHPMYHRELVNRDPDQGP